MHESLDSHPEMNETLNRPDFVVDRISDGFEFGHGNISAEEEDPNVLKLIDETIRNSPEILVKVDVDDDGCSDGRETTLVFTATEVFKKSLNRAKVFGGAVTMGAASQIGLGMARGQQLHQVFDSSIDMLKAKEIKFGAHTDENAADHAHNCGCGAIDRAPESLLAALKYQDPIRNIINVLGVPKEGLDEVFTEFRHYVSEDLSHPDKYSGRKVMEAILQAGSVVKRLGGDHRERRIVLNTVKGHTVNQRLIRMVTGSKAQVFAVDTWRMEEITAKLFPDDPEKQHKALLSELVYTLAVSAVLTRGDLPVYMIQDKPEAASN